MLSTSIAAPKATRDFAQALVDLRGTGACVLENALDAEMLADVATALTRAAQSDRKYGLARDYQFGGDDHANQRVWNLPSRDPVFCALAEHPLALQFIKEIIGWPALLSSMSANITGLGGQSMILHADQGYMPLPWSGPQGVNIGWCVNDFTAANGATCFIPGSHHWQGHGQGQLEQYRDQLVPIEAPAGSMLVMEGRLLHTNGINSNGVRRAGIFSWYTLPIYMPQENWFRSLNPAVLQTASETLLTLLGYRPGVMGRVNGIDRI